MVVNWADLLWALNTLYIGGDFGTITSEFRDVAGFKLMRNIIPKGSWPQKYSGTSRSAADCTGAL